MSVHNDNNKSHNLPSYINIPFFLYQDNRLEKSALLIAAFFYSLYTAGKSITASKDYLCELASIGKTQYFSTLNQLELLGYIKRSGFTNRKKIEWAYSPKSEIIVDESSTSPVSRTNVQKLNTSPANRTKLVRDPELILSGIPDTYNKEDTKDNKKLTTIEPPPSSSCFFSKTTDKNLLKQKLFNDKRTDEEFLKDCEIHVNTNSDQSLPHLQRANALIKLLRQLNFDKIIFTVKKPEEANKTETNEERMARYQREREANFRRRG